MSFTRIERGQRARMLRVQAPRARTGELVILHHDDAGYLHVVCFCRGYRRRDGTCATQRVVLDRLADPDTINRTLVEHETKSSPARALGQGGQ